MDTMVQTVGHNREKPSVYFNPTAQPVSKNPATVRISQDISFPFTDVEVVPDRDWSGEVVPTSVI
jgi:hypothetical protein